MSWEQLRTILAAGAAYAREERNNPPRSCPEDGEPLFTDKDGVLVCRFCGWSKR